ncbi:MAG: response regulator transcription factor [Kiritimatiellia bacterium]
MAEILIAEDEAGIRDGLKEVLEAEGHRVRAVCDGVQAVAAFNTAAPHLLLLDVVMPRMTGLEVCVRVRAVNRTLPILMLTAKNDASDVAAGLGLGADDYLAKPFRVPELLARIDAALRRQRMLRQAVSDSAEACEFGLGTLDLRNQLYFEGPTRRTSLTSLQTALLRLFVKNPDRIYTRRELHERGWGTDCVNGYRSVDQQIAKLRRKLGASGALIETVSGVGYRCRPGF